MRSRTVRLSVAALVLTAIGAVAAFIVSSEKKVQSTIASVSAFDVRAREAVDALAEVRAAEQAYLVPGQGLPFWMHKVATTLDTAQSVTARLRQTAASAPALSSLMEAEATLTEFENVDKRAREYMNAGQHLMASDVIFTEGGMAAATAARQIESARVAERSAADAGAADLRRREAWAAAAAAAAVALLVVMLVPVPRQQEQLSIAAAAAEPEEFARVIPSKPAAPVNLDTASLDRGFATDQAPAIRTTTPVLRAAADLAVAFGKVNEAGELSRLMERTADVLDATGVIVWMGNSVGGDLRAVLVYGYEAQSVARMPRVARSADNAAAKAYRTGELQIVRSRPGFRGAIVVPILRADGCVGAFSAEIQDGGESSEGVHAVAAIVAAQLGCVLPEAPVESLDDIKTATA